MHPSKKEGGRPLVLPAAHESGHQVMIRPESVLRNRLTAGLRIQRRIRVGRNVSPNKLNMTIGKKVSDDLACMITGGAPLK
jgi:hypothetical protein